MLRLQTSTHTLCYSIAIICFRIAFETLHHCKTDSSPCVDCISLDKEQNTGIVQTLAEEAKIPQGRMRLAYHSGPLLDQV